LRKIHLVALAIFLFVFPFISFSSDLSQKEKALNIFNEKVEVYISFERKFLNDDLLFSLSVDYVDNTKVFAYVNKVSFDVLLQYEVPFTVEKSPGDVDFDLKMKSWDEIVSNKAINEWDFYPTYEAYVSMMNQFEDDFPDMCKIYDAGTTVLGRNLLFAKISSDINDNNPRARFMYTSTIHGDETTGFILMLRLIDYLLTNYGVDDEITDLLDNVEIWICPNENPDGTYTNNNSTVNGATRSNANGIDLNRNYPNPVSSHSTQQPETLAMMSLVDNKHFVMSANMHGGIEVVNFPFDSWTSSNRKHADHNWWEWVSREYADTAQYYSPSGYMTAYGGTTHGGDWYVVYGSRQDYMNYYKNTRELTLELSDTKLLNPTLLPAHWNYNYRSFINYIKQSTYGFHGVVKDAETEEPISTKVTLVNHDKYNSEVFSNELGYFARPALSGTYTLRFDKYGYDPVFIENESISNYQTKFFEVGMEPWPSDISEIDYKPEIIVSPNPLTSDSKLTIKSALGFDLEILVYNSIGLKVHELHKGFIDSDYTEFRLNSLLNNKSGIYLIKVSGKDFVKTIKILIL
jgi:hypothetical protein